MQPSNVSTFNVSLPIRRQDLEFRTWHERFAWPLLAGIALLVLAQLLDETWLRRAP